MILYNNYTVVEKNAHIMLEVNRIDFRNLPQTILRTFSSETFVV